MNPEQASMLSSVLMLVLMFAVFYFILIRPQKKKEKKLREMIAALKVGDEVASIGGIHGKDNQLRCGILIQLLTSLAKLFLPGIAENPCIIINIEICSWIYNSKSFYI